MGVCEYGREYGSYSREMRITVLHDKLEEAFSAAKPDLTSL